MKPIIIDMREMSDSTEVYSSRPNRAVYLFIYLCLALLAAAVIWMCVFKIDIVVKGVGTVNATDSLSTITNQVAGSISSMNVQDGEFVTQGESLYNIDITAYEQRLEAYEKKLEESSERQEILTAYLEWLDNGQDIPEKMSSNLYYDEITSRKTLIETGSENSLDKYNGEQNTYVTKISTNDTMIAYYQNTIDKNKKLEQDIKNRENDFDEAESYYYSKVENYIAQYQNTGKPYDEKIAELERGKAEKEELLRECNDKKKELDEKKKNTLNSTVSQGDVIVYNDAAWQQEADEIETYIKQYTKAIEEADANIQSYVSQKSTALEAYEKQTLETVENTIFAAEQSIITAKNSRNEYANGKKILDDLGTENEITSLIAQEKLSVTGEIESGRQTKVQLQNEIENLKLEIDKANVKAPISGTVNMVLDLSARDYIGNGVQVMTIIPESEESDFIVKSYVQNSDIAKIKEGMEVTYEIAAYPTNEYGTMKGQVEFISADLKVNDSGSAYYLVETTVANTENLHNRMGEPAELKVGMFCETKIIIESKSVMELVLEKVFNFM